MFRFVVLSALVAITVAAPGGSYYHESSPVVAYAAAPAYTKTIVAEPTFKYSEKTVVKPEYTVVETPTVQHVGDVVKSFPTAVSHQSSTVVHNKASVVEPIYQHGVAKSVISTPKVEKHIIAEPAIHKTVYETPVAKAVYAAAPAYYAEPAYAKTAVYAEPAYAKAVYAEPAYTKAVYAEPAYTKAVYAEPTYAKAVYAPATSYAKSISYSAPLSYASYAEPSYYSSYKHY